MINYQPFTIEDIIHNLENNINFSFSRWNDGEWFAIKRKKGHNCDNHPYYPDMCDRMDKILQSKPQYVLGMIAKRNIKRFLPFIEEYQSKYPNTWVDCSVIHMEARTNGLDKLIQSLNKRDLIVVGDKSLIGISNTLNYKIFIEIPSKNCWLSYKQTLEILKIVSFDNAVILYSASMMSNILIDDMHTYNQNMTQIDCGSIWFPYIGKATRSYHKEMML